MQQVPALSLSAHKHPPFPPKIYIDIIYTEYTEIRELWEGGREASLNVHLQLPAGFPAVAHKSMCSFNGIAKT